MKWASGIQSPLFDMYISFFSVALSVLALQGILKCDFRGIIFCRSTLPNLILDCRKYRVLVDIWPLQTELHTKFVTLTRHGMSFDLRIGANWIFDTTESM